MEPDGCDQGHDDTEMTIGELMEWRYLRAEREKEQVDLFSLICPVHVLTTTNTLSSSQGNIAFKKGDYNGAIEKYKLAHQIEPEMPHYQLNLAAAYLKIHEYVTSFYQVVGVSSCSNRWIEAEKSCDAALSQHKSVKGHWRRAQARRAQARIDDAIKGEKHYLELYEFCLIPIRDLRAVLRLQPSNSEAAYELSLLVPPTPTPKSPPTKASRSYVNEPSSSSSGSSSHMGMAPSSPSGSGSSSSHRGSSSSTSKGIHLLHTSTKTLPFSQSFTDDRKLKISGLAMTIDVPIELPSLDVVSKGKNKGKRPTLPLLSSIRTQPETFVYPSWERYVVKRASD